MRVGEQHPESKQDTENGPGGTDRNAVDHREHLGWKCRARAQIDNQDLNETRAYPRDQVVSDKALGTPYMLQRATEHEYREHVKKHVRQGVGVVEEHVGDQLIQPEII